MKSSACHPDQVRRKRGGISFNKVWFEGDSSTSLGMTLLKHVLRRGENKLSVESRARIPKEGTVRHKVFLAIKEGKTPIHDTGAIARATGLEVEQVTITRANLRGAGYLPKPTPELTRQTMHTSAATVFPLVKEYREMGLSQREIKLAVKLEKETDLSDENVHGALAYNTKKGNLRRLSKEEKHDIGRDSAMLTPEDVLRNVTAILILRKLLLENNLPLPANRLEWKMAITPLTSIQHFATTLLQNPSQILRHPVLEKDVKKIYETIMARLDSVLSFSSIEEFGKKAQALTDEIPAIKKSLNAKLPTLDLHIGEDERSMWNYAIEHNLLPKILQTKILAQQEIDLLRRYFENGIIGEKLTENVFNKFTTAVARIS